MVSLQVKRKNALNQRHDNQCFTLCQTLSLFFCSPTAEAWFDQYVFCVGLQIKTQPPPLTIPAGPGGLQPGVFP